MSRNSWQVSRNRWQGVGNRWQVFRNRWQVFRNRWQVAGGRCPGIGGRCPGKDGRWQGIGGRCPGMDGKWPGIDSRLHVASQRAREEKMGYLYYTTLKVKRYKKCPPYKKIVFSSCSVRTCMYLRSKSTNIQDIQEPQDVYNSH